VSSVATSRPPSRLQWRQGPSNCHRTIRLLCSTISLVRCHHSSVGTVTLADICLIYARPSRRVVQSLHDILSRQYSVWWDDDIHAGDYRNEIERQLRAAKCVIPVWCHASRTSQNVVDEAIYAKGHHVPLLPVRIERVDFPIGLGGLHAVDMIDWNGDESDQRVQDLFRNIENTILTRPKALNVAGRRLPVPVFFRSVSSHETALRPVAAVQALKLVPPDALLVSAYDMINEPQKQRDQMIADLDSCRSAGSLVLLDSGNYEASRKHDKMWKRQKLHNALRTVPHDLTLCFDDLNPPSDIEGIVRSVVNSVGRDAKQTSAPVLPIVHAPRSRQGDIVFQVIPQAMKRICQELRPIAVAIPERELGSGILARARAVYTIRNALNELGFYQPLHLLGTGNPLSIAVLSAVGADWFDGLEWCRTVADSESGRLYHVQHYDFFAWQSQLAAASPIVKDAVTSDKIAFAGKAIFHNLDFFAAWMRELREDLHNDKIDRFLIAKLPLGKESMQLLEEAVPEVFR
jgi:queuine/archaeosine tRNA-ribosyltransferase